MIIKSTEELARNPKKVLIDIAEFLGLETDHWMIRNTKRYNYDMNLPVLRDDEAGNSDIIYQMREFYKPYNQELFDVIGKKFEWDQ